MNRIVGGLGLALLATDALALNNPPTYVRSIIHDLELINSDSPLVDPVGEWTMWAVITERQENENDVDNLHFFLVVTRAKNVASTYD